MSENEPLCGFIDLIVKSCPNILEEQKVKFKNNWFDKECLQARDEATKCLIKYRTTVGQKEKEA